METSPYKAKFTVLKFSQSSSKKRRTFGSATKPIRPFEDSPEKAKEDKSSFVTNLFGSGKFEV